MQKLIFIFVLAALVSGCTSRPGAESALQKMGDEMAKGNFSRVFLMADSLNAVFPDDQVLAGQLDSIRDYARRVGLDFSLSESEIEEKLEQVFPSFTAEEKQKWEDLNWLEFRMIDGEKRYFKRAAGNLKRILEHEALQRDSARQEIPDEFGRFKMDHAGEVIRLTQDGSSPVLPVQMKLRYTLTVKADQVPPGEIIRCWMPWPHESHSRQHDIRLIGTFPAEHEVAPDSVSQRSVYMEQKAEEGRPTLFRLEFNYRSSAQYFDPDLLRGSTQQKDSRIYAIHTREQKPHILFTAKIRELSDQIVGKEKEPFQIVKKIFYWIDENIPWAGALEYGIIPDIPGYVIDNRRGDCGMKTLLFMTLARYNGIPVKWQSGWMMHPGQVNLHDWCEIWFDGVGWAPLDMSFGRMPSPDSRIRDFYMTGIDSWRLIVNDDIGTPLAPAKKFPRSEPNDFQRGEVEWRGGNLYFDKWDYDMEVEYEPVE